MNLKCKTLFLVLAMVISIVPNPFDRQVSAQSPAVQLASAQNEPNTAEPAPILKDFVDIQEHWAKKDIITGVQLGILFGYPDGTFKPDGTITRAETASMLSRVTKLTPTSTSNSFADISNHWAKDQVHELVALGFIDTEDYPNGFEPNKAVTRFEVMKWISSGLAKSNADFQQALIETEYALLSTPESINGDVTSEQIPYIALVKGTGIIEGYPDATFQPLKTTTRAEVVSTLLRYAKVESTDAKQYTVLNELREKSNVLYPFRDGNSKVGFINRAGKVVIKPAFDYIQNENKPWVNNLLGVTVNRTRDSAGIINKEGKFVVEPVFYMARSIYDDKALVYGDSFRNMVVDSQGNVLSTSLFDLKEPSEGKLVYSHVNIDGGNFYFKYGYMNESDYSTFIGSELFFASSYSEGLAAIYKGGHPLPSDSSSRAEEGAWSYIDLQGNQVFETSYSAALPFNDGLAPVNQGGDWNVNIFGIFNVKGGVWGAIDRSGKTVVKPKYDSLYPFESGVARVKLKGKWGLIDRFGKELTKIQYDSIEPFKDGLALVNYQGKWGMLDTSGKAKISIQYDDLHNYSEDLAYAQVGEVKGYLDQSGKFKFKTSFALNEDFHEGLARVGVSSEVKGPIDKIGFIDKNGNIAIPLQFSGYAFFQEGLAMVYQYINGKEYQAYIDYSGKVIWSSGVALP